MTFEPNRSDVPNSTDDQFYCQENRNICVICAKDKDYARFHIVPSVYRTHMPESMKSHRSHDVVLLCFDCLSNGLKQQDILKRELAKKYDASTKEIS